MNRDSVLHCGLKGVLGAMQAPWVADIGNIDD